MNTSSTFHRVVSVSPSTSSTFHRVVSVTPLIVFKIFGLDGFGMLIQVIQGTFEEKGLFGSLGC